MKRVLFETDWLASTPVFYNLQTGQASHNVNDVVDVSNLEWDPEGVGNFLDFGYAVLEQTPLRNVRFLRHSARLLADETGRLSVEYLPDPVDAWLDRRRSEPEIIELLRARVRAWEAGTAGEIVIPISGGYDSRLLAWLVAEKGRSRSFTYGLSDRQSDSHEVVYARGVARALGIRWDQIVLGDYHRYLEEWDRLYGVSTHAHGMYQIDFYSQIRERLGPGRPLLSGIIGDGWAGISLEQPRTADDVRRLGYSHGMKADARMSRLAAERPGLARYFESQRDRLAEPRLRVIESMRFKIILLSYLLRIPRHLGFEPWSPFLDIEVALAMLNLPPERRAGRRWQAEFFQRQGLDIEARRLPVDRINTLNLQAMRRGPLPPLDTEGLGRLVRRDYVEWINRQSRPPTWLDAAHVRLEQTPKVGAVLQRLGLRSPRLTAYFAYLVLKPFDSLLRRAAQGRPARPPGPPAAGAGPTPVTAPRAS